MANKGFLSPVFTKTIISTQNGNSCLKVQNLVKMVKLSTVLHLHELGFTFNLVRFYSNSDPYTGISVSVFSLGTPHLSKSIAMGLILMHFIDVVSSFAHASKSNYS